MKDFLRIFIVLCAVVSAFFLGRNYGEVTTTESVEIKTLKSENFQNQNAQEELKNLKDKFQKLLDSADLKKADEVWGQVMTIFLADLSLQLSEEKQKDFEIGKNMCSPSAHSSIAQEKKSEIKDRVREEVKSVIERSEKNTAKFKAAEFEMAEAQDTENLRRALNKLELKKIDSLLDGAPETSFQKSKKFFGSYRGSILDVTGKIYGTMVFDIQNTPEQKNPITGKIQIYRNGELSTNSNFTTTALGYSPENSAAIVLSAGPNNYLQLYKSESLQKIAGIYYERLPNGTSKTIGTFILSRTDFAD